MQFDFFLSHNRAEKDWVRRLAAALRARNAAVFFDEDSVAIGEDIVSAMEGGLSSSRYIVLILSKRSVQSRWVELEWASTIFSDVESSSNRLLPLLIEDCEIPFVLRRLKYLNVIGVNPEQCAERLLSHLDSQSNSVSTERETNSGLPLMVTGTPLPYGSPQYIERTADRLASAPLEAGESLFVYGQRRIGKTSMLIREAARAKLRGKSVAFIDLQGYSYELSEAQSDQYFDRLGWELSEQFGTELQRLWRGPYGVQTLIRTVANQSGSEGVLLAIDECDSLRRGGAGEQFTSMLRSLLNPLFGNIQCICAGLVPPWVWPDQSLVSPWWNNMRQVYVAAFSFEQVTAFWRAAGLSGEESLPNLYALTAGQPTMTAQAAREVANGLELSDLLASAHSTQGPFIHIATSLLGSAEFLLEERANTAFRDLASGEPIHSFRDREFLWLTGVITGPEINPPEIAGGAIRAALGRYLSERV